MVEELLLEIRNKRVLVIGDVMLDVYCNGIVSRMNPEEPAAPLLDLVNKDYRAGGAANVAMNAVDLGARVTLIGVVGKDPAAEILREIFQGRGIAFHGSFGKYSPKTIEKSRLVVGGRQIARFDSEEKNPERYRMDVEKMSSVISEKVRESDVVIFSDYAKGAVDRTLLKVVSQAAKDKGIFVVLDPKPKNKMNFSGLVDVITPNRKEALELAGLEPQIDFSAGNFPQELVTRKIHERYDLRHLVVTMSEAGFLVSSKNGIFHQVPTYARKIFDVTGAGDTFVTALACALAAGADIDEAAELGNLAAGVVVEKPGTATATPEEIVNHARLMLPESWQT